MRTITQLVICFRDEETKEVDSRDKVKQNERSDQLFLERMMKLAEQE